jgi:hypothetical protein
MGVSVNGGHVPGKKKARLAAHGRACGPVGERA